MDKSVAKIRQAIENETDLTPEMQELIYTAANLLDTVADNLTFNELVSKHMGDTET